MLKAGVKPIWSFCISKSTNGVFCNNRLNCSGFSWLYQKLHELAILELDYIHRYNAFGENIVRLYHFNAKEAAKLSQLIKQTLLAEQGVLDLTTIDFITPRNCKLVLRISSTNEGIITHDGIHFFCNLTLEGYEQMLAAMAPFCIKDSKGYQWLYEADNPIDFLFSPAGTW